MNDPGWGHGRPQPVIKGVPPWVFVVVSVAAIAVVGFGGCVVAVAVLARRPHASPASSAPVAVSSDDFVIVVADKTQAPADVFRAAAVSAAARNLKPFVYATASWCAPCQKLNKSMGDPRMRDAFKGTYVVKLDIDEFDDKALEALGMRVRAVPSFYELGAGGLPTGRSMIGDWGADVPANMAPALKKFFKG
jgi:thiol:disulfide interchange protein